GKPEEHLEPDGRRQMEAEAALEHTRELSKEPTREADWSPEMERQREAEEAIKIGRGGAEQPAAPAASGQDEVEAIFGQAKAAAPAPVEEAASSTQLEAERIMSRFGQKGEGGEEPPAPEEIPAVAGAPEEAAPAKADISAKQRDAEEIFAQFISAQKAVPEEEPVREEALSPAGAPEEAAPAKADISAKQRDVEDVFAQFLAAQKPVPEQEPAQEQAEAVAEPSEPAMAATGPSAPEPGESPPILGYEDELEMGEGEGEEFFAPMAAQEPAAAMAAEEESPSDPLSDKLSSIANEVTLMESDMADKKAVSDVMLSLEEIQAELLRRDAPWEVVAVSDAMAGLYERILMEGVADSKRAVDLTISGVMILSAYLENPSLEAIKEQGIGLLADLKEIFGVAPQKTSMPSEAEPARAAAPSIGAVYDKKGPKFLGYESVQMATSEDLLIYTEFVSEVNDAMAHLESDLLELESTPQDMELVNDLFRGYHSMKGAAGFLGVNTVNIICHEAEGLLDKFRKGTMISDQSCVDVLLKSLDVIKMVNEGLHESCEKAKMNMPGAYLEIPRFDVGQLVAAFGETSVKREAEMAQLAVLEAEAKIEAEEKEEEKTALLGQILLDEGKVTEEDVELALRAQMEKRPLGEILVEMGVVDQPSLEQALMDQADRKKKMKSASLKIDTEKLDSLLELVGELVISQSIVSQEAVFLKVERAKLAKNIQNLGKITKSIQDQVMTLRMVPLKQTFQKMSRLVRDLSKKMKKQVTLHVTGEETEIDKTIIEELNDPLVHLLRNAMDHGIETPEERAIRNKPRTGNIWLNAYHRGGNVYIEVIDDGRGLDKEKIKRKALEKGLVEEDAEMSDQEAYALVLMPGFSTHDQATDISGRGVGMDVVRSNIDALGGRLDISSKPGEGSEFTVRLPLTMAIVDGMIVQIGEERFVIPTISIRESIRPQKEDVSTFKNKGEMVNVRGKLLPLVRLRKFLGMQNGGAHNPWEGLVIIVESDEREFGFLVDDLLGQQQVVIKSLDKRFKGLPGISGGTILGDGRVGLILDVGSVVEYN
ncbi:MAG: chemotaxis protein CheA, partial [Nitrospinota bacterium]|nr:chemotaxis protein CheA [Nitrospinota bacterium]